MTSNPPIQHLGACKPGFNGTISGFMPDEKSLDNTAIEQLREMGFAEGLAVAVLHQNPFGKDPIAVRVGAMTIALRRRQANLVQVTQP